jgi:tRNA G18 (ribose-2'-O)-methylase SpoU
MVTRRELPDAAAPELIPYRTMKAQHSHLGGGVFVAEGDKVVHRLIESRLGLRSVLAPPAEADALEARLRAAGRTADLFVAPRAVLEGFTGFPIYQGILALGEVPRPDSLHDLLSGPGPALLTAMDGLTSGENVGAVIRNASAFGARGLIIGPTSAHPYLRRSVRSSMGTVFGQPYVLAASLPESLRQLRALGVTVVAAHPGASACSVHRLPAHQPLCVVLGAEGEGISPEVLDVCDVSASIAMESGVDSLNVAAASAVFFSEIRRLRGSPQT